jgi:hypothetical protein
METEGEVGPIATLHDLDDKLPIETVIFTDVPGA